MSPHNYATHETEGERKARLERIQQRWFEPGDEVFLLSELERIEAVLVIARQEVDVWRARAMDCDADLTRAEKERDVYRDEAEDLRRMLDEAHREDFAAVRADRDVARARAEELQEALNMLLSGGRGV